MSNTKLTVDQKFAKTINELRAVRPFYSAIYESMERVESKSVDTMGVTANKMYYNHNFVDKLTFKKLMFIQLHEIGHVSLMHVSRIGKRDQVLWNIACDLYVNKLLADEFDIEPGETDRDKLVTFPEDGVYCSSLDLESDYVEEIYEDLLKQANKNGYSSFMNGNQSDNQDESKDENQDNSTENQSFKFTFEGKDKTGNSKYSKCELNIAPKIYKIDIIDDGSDELQKQNDNQKILNEAVIRNSMQNKDAGNQKGLLERKVDEVLKSYIDWRKLLRKFCITLVSKDSSFSIPDKRMYYQNAIYPGQSSDETNYLKGVKVCIDTSGSISNTDMAYFNGQVQGIIDKFKVDAELIYWDTIVESTGNFKDQKEYKNIKSAGLGGTSPKCIFEYFDSNKCKIKPIVSIIFTDGYFYDDSIWNNAKWRKKYKNTIWVMTRDYNRDYKPPFGKLTIAKFDKS